MKKFYILERMACVVTWRFPVEAESESEAFEKYRNGDFGPGACDPEIGDSIDCLQFDLEIEEVPRDVIARIEELEDELRDATEAAGNTWDADETARRDLTREQFIEEHLDTAHPSVVSELAALKALAPALRKENA